MQFVAFSKFSWFPDLHSDDCIDEEEHSNEQDDVRQRLREEKMIATTTTTMAMRTMGNHFVFQKCSNYLVKLLLKIILSNDSSNNSIEPFD